MATIALIPDNPVEQDRAYSYVTQLGLREYNIRIEYRERQDRWYLRLLDADNVPIISGLKLVVGFSLLFRYQRDVMPLGALVVLDIDGAGVECGFEDLGRRCPLVFIDEADLLAPPVSENQVVVLT
jgi:hypothetical protein